MALYKISSSRVNNIDAAEFSGSPNEEGLIWYDPATGVLRLHNGEPGGQILSSAPVGTGVLDLSAVAQDIIPATDTQYSLGTAEKRWKDLFVSDGTVYIGDTKLSNQNGALLIGDLVSDNPDPSTIIRAEKDVNNFASLSLRNVNDQNLASADILLYQGTAELNHYIDIGIASKNYAYPGFEILKPNDGYIFVAGGDLKIGTSHSNDVVFFTGGTSSDQHEIARLRNQQGLEVYGSISATRFLGDGSLLTGINANYSNADVAAFLPTYTGNLLSLTGDISTTGNIHSNYFIGNGSQLTGIVATDVGLLPSLTVTGNIDSSGTISAEFFVGDGSKLTGITAEGLPTQVGNAGFFLSTSGDDTYWNHALGSSLTFYGGRSSSIDFGNTLDGGAAGDDFTNAATIFCGEADSDYELTLSAIALTGQYQDIDYYNTITSPSSSVSPGIQGQVTYDNDWIYVCVANNAWKRTELSTW